MMIFGYERRYGVLARTLVLAVLAVCLLAPNMAALAAQSTPPPSPSVTATPVASPAASPAASPVAGATPAVVLDTAGPAEFEARIRLLATSAASDGLISSGGIVIDDAAYSVVLEGEPLDLTYTEFELLKYLVQHPGRVFSREHLLADVWGYDYYGGTRTVDVHVRRLRAKLGPEHEALIGTVRNVGYRCSPDGIGRR